MSKTWKDIYKESLRKELNRICFESFIIGYAESIALDPCCTPAERGRCIKGFFEALQEVQAEQESREV